MTRMIKDNILMSSVEDLLALHKDVAEESGEAWLLWQDPTFIGFAKVFRDRLEIQPEGPSQLDFALIRDLRIFGVKGEWHVWLASAEKLKGGFLPAIQSEGPDILTVRHLLWGTWIENDNSDGWTCVSEERGMRLWLPRELKAEDLPFSLPVRQIVGYDQVTGLAGIIDAMLLLPKILKATEKKS